MSEARIHINMHLNGTIAVADFVKIASMIQAESYNQLNVGEPISEQHAADINFVSGKKWPDEVVSNVSEAVAPFAAPVEPSTASTTTSSEPAGDSDEVDAHGWPWSPDLHASTKGTTKDGLWRMKVGVSRPEPKAGFPKTTETPSSTSTPSQASPAASGATEPAGSSPTAEPVSAAASQEDDDEFAAFRAAAAKADATDAAATAAVPPRTYTDADLGALCNQAAVKMGDPTPVKEIIAKFVPAGEVAHSRNVPQDKRADFVAAVEAKAGIEFAG
jgi:hypothetical protein